MCGRYALGVNPDVAAQVRHDYPALNPRRRVEGQEHRPRYNVAPRSNAPVVRQDPQGDHEVFLQTMQWGVIPHWTKHSPDKSSPLNTINARSEALVDGGPGMWNSLKGKKRCLVVCDGYYEWLTKGKQKVPHFTRHPDGRCMLLAGMWDSVTFEGTTEPLFTYTIITTDSNKELSFLHDRMPVILSSEEDIRTWLDPAVEWSNEKLGKLLRPYEGHLECYPVPQEVGNVRKESATFIQPISTRSDGIQAMFKKQEKKQEETASSSQPEGKASTSPSISPSENKQSSTSREATLKRERTQSGDVTAFVTDDNQPGEPGSPTSSSPRKKRKATDEADEPEIVEVSPSRVKRPKVEKETPSKTKTPAKGKKGDDKKTPKKGEEKKSVKITNFFTKA